MNTLTEELLIEIVERSSVQSLVALAATSRAFNRCATPRLYRYVHYSCPKEQIHPSEVYVKRGLNQSMEWLSSPDTSSRIFHIEPFFYTMRQSLALWSLVTGMSFIWHQVTPEDVKMCIHEIIKMLDFQVRWLHIAPQRFMSAAIAFSPPQNLTSLDLWWPRSDSWNDDLHPVITMDDLYQIFCIPTLRILSLKKVRQWTPYTTDSDINIQRSSNITSLSFPVTVPIRGGTGMCDILTWPKALQAIQFQTQVKFNLRRFEPGSGRDSARSFIDALNFQSSSLEEILFTGTGDDRGSDGTTVGNLRHFTSLKRLALPRRYMAKTEEELSFIDAADLCNYPPLYSILPPNLEQLYLEVEREFEWDPEIEVELEPYNYVHELKEWLCDVAKHKPTLYPALRRVTIWEERSRSASDPRHVSGKVEIRGCTAWLQAAFDEVKIELVHEVTKRGLPPIHV